MVVILLGNVEPNSSHQSAGFAVRQGRQRREIAGQCACTTHGAPPVVAFERFGERAKMPAGSTRDLEGLAALSGCGQSIGGFPHTPQIQEALTEAMRDIWRSRVDLPGEFGGA